MNEKAEEVKKEKHYCSGCVHCRLDARDQRALKSLKPVKGPWSVRYVVGKKVFFEGE